MEAKDRICKNPDCGLTFKPKRSNEEYHNFECKVISNNRIARENRLAIKKVDTVLKKNWLILDRLYKNGILDVTLEGLVSLGIDFTKHTGRYLDQKTNKSFPEFYNYRLENAINNKFKIVLI
ncbi:MAG: hypothetical protein ACK50A_08560 [Sphingobacteriaceae bacterium]|jgi:hypothetical protein